MAWAGAATVPPHRKRVWGHWVLLPTCSGPLLLQNIMQSIEFKFSWPLRTYRDYFIGYLWKKDRILEIGSVEKSAYSTGTDCDHLLPGLMDRFGTFVLQCLFLTRHSEFHSVFYFYHCCKRMQFEISWSNLKVWPGLDKLLWLNQKAGEIQMPPSNTWTVQLLRRFMKLLQPVYLCLSHQETGTGKF